MFTLFGMSAKVGRHANFGFLRRFSVVRFQAAGAHRSVVREHAARLEVLVPRTERLQGLHRTRCSRAGFGVGRPAKEVLVPGDPQRGKGEGKQRGEEGKRRD